MRYLGSLTFAPTFRTARHARALLRLAAHEEFRRCVQSVAIDPQKGHVVFGVLDHGEDADTGAVLARFAAQVGAAYDVLVADEGASAAPGAAASNEAPHEVPRHLHVVTPDPAGR